MNYEYNKLLKFLYFEGYADSYEEAEYLLEDLDDDEFEELLAEMPYQIYGPPSHGPSDAEPVELGKPYQNKKRAKNKAERLNLEIGGHRHFVRRVDEELLDVYEARDLSAQTTKIKPGTIAGGEGSVFRGLAGALPDPNSPEEIERSEKRRKRGKKLTFDVREQSGIENFVLLHLISEGYTDNYDSAIAIYESMSDEWVNDILKEEFKDLTPDKEKRVRERMHGFFTDMQDKSKRMEALRKIPFGKYRPKVREEKAKIVRSATKTTKLMQNATDAVGRTIASRQAKQLRRMEDLKQQLRDLGEEP